ncbi:hypothetical protein DWQ65_00310 [Treponema phagedenis]|uniref:Flavodoxin-like domain-containing protein n=1 Tax=Treponema phagedenis TaxID=162 RepID=A0A0B7GRI6_TREPH|nr:hypothetical protein [Treponema phagedenis]EFW38838.1 hypothetical protein HMPREF9554_00660 [Treponema phagedenis F0421]NVP24735.1 hypothetical protein [Treponema phagedenis]QEJ95841.1 hypothetical protein FUT79_11960 [Treponema phagedenis]QEJ98850.1 hypothetical protein FUT82_13170 [Treponema phagedenis]QEK00459.1 hypothetical protein FUT84_04205 [Treponema phagedenis]
MIGLIYFSKNNAAQKLLDSILNAAKEKHADIRLIDGNRMTETDRLTPYQYLAVFIGDKSFFQKKPDPKTFDILKNHGNLQGKKGAVFTLQNGFFSQKFCKNVMENLEAMGMLLDYFKLIKNTTDASIAGKNIG